MHFVLRIIGWLYECEKLWADKALAEPDLRRQRAKDYPRKLHWLRRVVTGLRERALSKSGLHKASDYMLRFWTPLTEHLHHGITRLGTNIVENVIRPSAIGKKNFLFIGHPDAGQRSAITYSIVVSCQRRGIDPLLYLRDVLPLLPKMNSSEDLEPLATGILS